VQRLRATVGKATQHKGGKISTTLAEDRKSAMENAWLVVEVINSLSYVLEPGKGGSSGDGEE
jgi:hypothetical protein